MSSDSHPDLPVLGHRNYWYPIIEARKVRHRPVTVRALGEEIVLFRDLEGVAALLDRCPHRGAKLSCGRTIFPGTITCGYHGWTYNRHGACLASIIEGPESKIVGKVHAKAYPTKERFGVVWAFLGEGKPPELDEDLPPELLESNIEVQWKFLNWSCNWRTFTENAPDMLHAYFVHRNSFNLFFQRIPACGRMAAVEPLPDGKGIRVARSPISMQAEYPGLGRFPRHNWWRILKGTSGGQIRWGYIRMPGHIVTPGADPYLKLRLVNIQFPLPIDEQHTRILNVNITYPRSNLHRLALKLWYRTWYLPWHLQFLNQDRRLIESQIERYPEKLSASDTGVIQWRRFAMKTARQPDVPFQRVTSDSDDEDFRGM